MILNLPKVTTHMDTKTGEIYLMAVNSQTSSSQVIIIKLPEDTQDKIKAIE